MAFAHASPSRCVPAHTHCHVADVCAIRSGTQSHTVGGHTLSNFSLRSVFTTGHPLRRSICQRSIVGKATKISIRCEQSSQKGNGVDVWLGRLAMVGFAVALSVEIGTGKGVLENLGLTAPLPTVALAIISVVGVLAAVFIFQSASKD